MEVDRLRQANIEHGDRANAILNVIEERLQKEMIPSVQHCDIFNIARTIHASATDLQDVVQHIDSIKGGSEHVDLRRYKERLNQRLNKSASEHQNVLHSVSDICICTRR